MPKLYYPTPDELQGATPLNELVWFEQYQHLLIKLANTDWGRDLLLIDKYPYPVVAIGKNYVRFHLGVWDDQDHYLSDFRVGAKWGNIIRSRWLDIRGALDYMWLEQAMEWPLVGAGRSLAMARFTTTAFFPDPHPESTTVDGHVVESGAQSWSSQRNATAGSSNDDSGTVMRGPYLNKGSGGNWQGETRAFVLFLTSSLGADIIDSATFEAVVSVVEDDISGGAASIILTNPASNTTLENEDYDNVTFTKQATDVTLSGMTVDGTTYTPWTLNSTGLGNIDGSGVTKFGTESAWIVDDAEPSADQDNHSRIDMDTAETSGTSEDPKLVVVHSSAFTPKTMMF